MKIFLKVSAVIIVIAIIYFAGYFVGTYNTYWMAHDEFLGRCIGYAHDPVDKMWCKYFVGDVKDRTY